MALDDDDKKWVRGEIADTKRELRTEIGDAKRELRDEIQALRGEMRGGFAGVTAAFATMGETIAAALEQQTRSIVDAIVTQRLETALHPGNGKPPKGGGDGEKS